MPRTHSLLVGSFLILALACSGDSLTVPPTAGVIEVRTSTTGAEPDTDGYTIQVDDQTPLSIGPSASLQTSEVASGSHTVHLAGLAGNCVVAANPVSVSVTAGQTATVSFAVICSATTGSLQISSTTSGPAPDADGYTVTIDGVERGPLGAAGAMSIEGLTPESHIVGLSGVAANCQVQGENPRAVTITAGAGATVAFEVICTDPPATAGTLRIATITTGTDPDSDGYTIAVDGGATQSIGINTAASLGNVAAGEHSVRLAGVATNCTVQGANPRTATVLGGATAEMSFAITCSATSGTVQVNVTTTGLQVDANGYIAKLDGSGTGKVVDVTGSVTFSGVPAGNHTIVLSDVASNCRVADGLERTISVTAGSTGQVTFAITCTIPSLQWTKMNSGTDQYPFATVWAASPNRAFTAGHKELGDACFADNTIRSYDGGAWTPMTAPIFAGPEAVRYPEHSGMWGSSASNVFLVGAVLDDGCLKDGVSIFHYDGSGWSSQWLAGGSVGPLSVWGRSADEIYIVGTKNNRPLVLSRNGTAWTEMSVLPGADGEGVWLRAIWGSSNSNLYAVGGSPPNGSRGIILHFDGTGWSRVTIPETAGIADIWGNAADNIWAVGDAGRILHYDGSNWNQVDSPVTQRLTAVWGSSSTDVFAVGSRGTILHYDGATWSQVQSGTTEDLFDIWGGSSTSVFAVGAHGTLLHGTR